MENLKDLATRGGHTVVISIHQPRSSIFTLFDDVVLMTEGEVVYAGEAAKMVPYFASLGYPCPKNFNPAEHVLDLGRYTIDRWRRSCYKCVFPGQNGRMDRWFSPAPVPRPSWVMSIVREDLFDCVALCSSIMTI